MVILRRDTREHALPAPQPHPAWMTLGPGASLSCELDSARGLMHVGVYVDAFNLYYGVVLTSVVGYLAGAGLTFERWRRPWSVSRPRRGRRHK